jgi:hypothetical protein
MRPIIRSSRGTPRSKTCRTQHIREGVVVRPVQERFDPQIGRAILKYLSDDYLLNDKLTAADATDL